MNFIVRKMDEFIEALRDYWTEQKEFILDLAELGLAIIHALFMIILFVTLPVWIVPYIIYRRRRDKNS